jgi:hypothetical protein
MQGGQAAYLSSTRVSDITSGNNGSCGTYFCQAQVSYDGPTGMGTPAAVSSASASAAVVINITNSLDLGRYVRPGVGHWVTTGTVSADYVGGNPGFEENPLGGLSTSGGTGFQALYSCRAGPDIHFLSSAPGCEGQKTLGLDGYSLVASAPNTMQIYRCMVPASNEHFVSLDPNCEGNNINEGSLGFITTNIHVARAYNGILHASFSGAASAGYSFEQTSGDTQAYGGITIYNCRAGVMLFTTTDKNCEGQTHAGVIAYGFSASPGVGLSALYRCYLPADGDHYDTTSSACEGAPGATNEGILAYVSAA